jgi:hypothetical protein
MNIQPLPPRAIQATLNGSSTSSNLKNPSTRNSHNKRLSSLSSHNSPSKASNSLSNNTINLYHFPRLRPLSSRCTSTSPSI